MLSEFSPLGFFGNMAIYFVVALCIPIVFVFMWPRGVSRRAAFFSVTFIVGAILACVAIVWHLAPYANVGTSGGPITPEIAEKIFNSHPC
jgi:hypothetical protein